MASRAGRIVVGVVGVFALGTGAIGFLHTPAGRPILGWMLGECPLGFDADLTSEQRDGARTAAFDAVRGESAAIERPALAFVLGTTTRADIAAWSAEHHVSCTDKLATTRCEAASAEALGAHDVDSVFFSFDGQDRLMSVTTEVSTTAEDAVRLHGDALTVAKRAGPVTTERGEASAEWLTSGLLNQLSTELRFTDYRAQITATNFRDQRVKVREIYQIPSAPTAPTPAP